jgi:4-hydroxy-tetrahydrodipicolinate synthase
MSAGPGRIAGLVPIVATPFDAHGHLDEDSLRREVEFLIGAGVDGVTVFGVAGEFYALSDAERGRGVRFAVEQAAGRVPVIAGTGHTGTDVAVALSREAEKAGAAAVMLIMPFFVRPDAAGAYAYCAAVARAVRVPIMVQDQPHTTGVTLPVPLLVRMARELAGVRLAKIETPAPVAKIAELVQAAGDALTVLGGTAGVHLLEEVRAGSQGTMPAALMPQVYRAIWDAARAGEWARAGRLFSRYFPLIRLTNQPGLGPSLVKSLLHWAGIIDTTHVRGPAPTADAITLAALRETAEALNVLEIMAGRAPVVEA